jgi:FAD/FMN-containing dehydrogenase
MASELGVGESGQVYDHVVDYEVVLGNATVWNATASQRQDLWQVFTGSSYTGVRCENRE